MNILFTGGGSAGHIIPIISIVRELRAKDKEGRFEFFYIGPKDDFSNVLLAEEGIKVKNILAGKIRRYFSPLNFFDILIKIPISFFQSFFYIFTISPDLIFSKGGYGSLGSVICGWLLFTPVFIHESDISPGLVNKIASKLALTIFTSFPKEKIKEFTKKKTISVGNPLRREILAGSKEKAVELFGLSTEKPIILVLGGSQGAKKINENILEILPDFLKEFELIHQTGQKNFKQISEEAKVAVYNQNLLKYYHPHAFLNEEELSAAYAVCDLVVSRAGAGSIFEISAVGKPSVLIPLPSSAQNHQVKNAYFYAKLGAAIVIEESNFTPHFFLERLKYLFSQPQKLKQMAVRAKEFAEPNAAEKIADYIYSFLKS